MNARSRVTAVVLAALALGGLLAACGGGSTGSTKASSKSDSSTSASLAGSDSTDSSSSKTGEIMAPLGCSLLTAAQIHTATALEILDGKDRGSDTSCVWRTPPVNGQIGDEVVLIEERTSEVENGQVVEPARAKYQAKLDGNPEGKVISEVGDAAFVLDQGNQVSVYTVKHDVLMWLIFGEPLTKLDLPGKPVDIATALAKQAVSNLP